ncbi:hypothetical protein BJP36_22935 [Moorena producens JHB]|uniref:Uncharacterized protein n=1 Tax=Moorena producens (strain JHB) TaxID=1454205 RepID=A0A1D9G422_MOOP1|nr:hypothetical protein [Moorena producens]AOY82333.1 hypothetical protein BJP36_22935 [Moorena producens JHB]
MKPTLTKILPSFGKQTSLALTALALTAGIVSNVQAQSLPSDFKLPQQSRGFFVDSTNSSQRFFEQGRFLGETEIKNLFNNQLSSADSILEISDEVVNREDILELENPQQLLDDGDS